MDANGWRLRNANEVINSPRNLFNKNRVYQTLAAESSIEKEARNGRNNGTEKFW